MARGPTVGSVPSAVSPRCFQCQPRALLVLEAPPHVTPPSPAGLALGSHLRLLPHREPGWAPHGGADAAHLDPRTARPSGAPGCPVSARGLGTRRGGPWKLPTRLLPAALSPATPWCPLCRTKHRVTPRLFTPGSLRGAPPSPPASDLSGEQDPPVGAAPAPRPIQDNVPLWDVALTRSRAKRS